MADCLAQQVETGEARASSPNAVAFSSPHITQVRVPRRDDGKWIAGPHRARVLRLEGLSPATIEPAAEPRPGPTGMPCCFWYQAAAARCLKTLFCPFPS